MEQEIQQLKKEIEELKRWKEQKERQQIKLPLDTISTSVLSQQFPKFVADKVAGAVAVTGYFTVEINGRIYKLLYN